MEPTSVTSACPTCGTVAERMPYDIGSGAELSCSACEWCWGAEGQDLRPLDVPAILASFTCSRCGRVSYHTEDLRQGYCGACHDFTGAAPAGGHTCKPCACGVEPPHCAHLHGGFDA